MRLIDADAWIEAHCEGCGRMEYGLCTTADPVCGAVKVTKNAPTVDAVEVVRCKDCEYKRELEGHLVCGDSMRAGMGVDVFEIPTYYFGKIAPDDFCSRGRKKDNG